MLCGLQQGEKNPQISHQSNPRLGLHNVLVSDQCKIQSSNAPQTFTISSKKKKRFLTFLKNKPLAFLDTVALKITDFLVCCCCFFFFYSNTKYFLHYQFSHFKASIVKQHTYIARTPYSPLQTPTDEHFQTCEYFCDYSNKGEVQIEHHCKQLF